METHGKFRPHSGIISYVVWVAGEVARLRPAHNGSVPQSMELVNTLSENLH